MWIFGLFSRYFVSALYRVMILRPPCSRPLYSSAASDVSKGQITTSASELSRHCKLLSKHDTRESNMTWLGLSIPAATPILLLVTNSRSVFWRESLGKGSDFLRFRLLGGWSLRCWGCVAGGGIIGGTGSAGGMSGNISHSAAKLIRFRQAVLQS